MDRWRVDKGRWIGNDKIGEYRKGKGRSAKEQIATSGAENRRDKEIKSNRNAWGWAENIPK